MKIMIDIDGVMNRLLETACKMHGIDYTRIRCYSLSRCEDLTEEERKQIMSEFHNVECFKRAWCVPTSEEVEAMRALCTNAEVYVHSLSYTREIADFKLAQLLKYYPRLNEQNIILDVVDEVAEKEVAVYDIIIEDCFENIEKAKEVNPNCIGIVVDHLYNVSAVCTRGDEPNLIVRSSFTGALTTALEIVYDDLEEDSIYEYNYEDTM